MTGPRICPLTASCRAWPKLIAHRSWPNPRRARDVDSRPAQQLNATGGTRDLRVQPLEGLQCALGALRGHELAAPVTHRVSKAWALKRHREMTAQVGDVAWGMEVAVLVWCTRCGSAIALAVIPGVPVAIAPSVARLCSSATPAYSVNARSFPGRGSH